MTAVRSRGQIGNLPYELKSFVGRGRALQEARRLLGEARLLTLVGVGGVGKTRLALRVAAEVRRTFPDGVWLAEFAPLQDEDLVPQTVITALGLRDDSARPPMDTLSDHLADKRLLLVLDNCEHLPDACATLVAALLGASTGLRILATSRQVLNVEGEQVLEVPPLSAPDPDLPVANSSLIEYEAVSLFADRAAAVAPGFRVTADNGPAVAAMCRRLDGIPLAIELAAVRLRVLSVEQILERLDDRFRLLTRGNRRALARHQTLKAMIDWSYDLCSAQERTLWARLSVFSGGFDLEAAEKTCSDEHIPRHRVFELVGSLVDKSVLACERHSPRIRYRLLETIRQYGHERLSESGQEEWLHRRHRDYYCHMALRAQAEFLSPRQVEWFQRLRQDLPNIRVALERSLSEPDQAQACMRSTAALLNYWIFYGLLGEARQWLIRALRLDPRPTLVRVKALAAATHITLLQGDRAAALPLRDESFALARRLGDRRAIAHATHIAGLTAWAQGDLETALPLLTEALERSRTEGDDPIEAFLNLLFLAMATGLHGDDRSATYSLEAMAAGRSTGGEWLIAWGAWTLGLHHWKKGDNQRATDLFQKSLRIHRTIYNLWGYAFCTEALAWTATADGRHERAARLLGATQAFLRSVGGLGGFHLVASAHERCEAQLCHVLGDDAFAAAVRRGTELSLDEAISYALDEDTTGPATPPPPPRIY